MKQLSAFINEGFPPKPTWTASDMPDLTGKIAIVTGANNGVGKETVKALLQHNARVYIAARSKEKADAAIKDLQEQTGNKAIFLQLDLADLKSVRNAANEFMRRERELHLLFNNGGVMAPPIQFTKQGYDLQFGTNVIGHFYFTKLLLPTLLETAKHAPKGSVRVVTTASDAIHMFQKMDYDTLRDSPQRDKLGAQGLYAQSKAGNVLFAKELAKRYGDQGIVSTSCNPGHLKSDLFKHQNFVTQKIIGPFLHPVELGAITQLYAGTSPEGANLNGKYLIPWARVGETNKAVNSADDAKMLWEWLENEVMSF